MSCHNVQLVVDFTLVQLSMKSTVLQKHFLDDFFVPNSLMYLTDNTIIIL